MKKDPPTTGALVAPTPDEPGKNLPMLVPKGLEQAYTPEEWAAMPEPERNEAIAFFQDEAAKTVEGAQLTLPRWKFPTSGATHFVMATDEQDAPETKELRGVVIAKMPGRAYYKPGAAAAKGTPPACSSSDAVVPDTVPSPVSGAKTCVTCEFAQWGSGINAQGQPTRGQACKYRTRVFFRSGDAPLPEYISLPPTAGKVLGAYITGLVQKKVPLIMFETVFGLQKQTSRDGIEFQGLTLRLGDKQPIHLAREARELSERYDSIMRRVTVGPDDHEEDAAATNGSAAAGTTELLDKDGKKVETAAAGSAADPKAGF